ncbi:MAG: hypothetical protein H0U98_01575 [Alphaproteobacteria bacterium]|nr:hypothetical protein [Alphaproteobacteria bacterium]
MRLLFSFLALALSISAVQAGDVGPLSPGAPAGVKRAQEGSNIILYSVLGVGAIAGFAVALTSGNNSNQQATTPTATSIASTV